jgi:hypothetical protein
MSRMPSLQSSEMFIETVAEKNYLAPEERNVRTTECFAPTELGSFSESWFYKHLVPLGPETTATKKYRLICYTKLRVRTLPLLMEHGSRDLLAVNAA